MYLSIVLYEYFAGRIYGLYLCNRVHLYGIIHHKSSKTVLQGKDLSVPATEDTVSDMMYQVPTICPYCGTGCSVNLIVQDGKITGTTPNIRSPVNEGKLCQKGTYCHQFIQSPDRLKKPLVRRGDVFVETDWESAYQLIAQKLKEYRPSEIGVLASAQCSNEDNYVLMKFARGVLKTNNLDHSARLCHEATMIGLSFSFGNGTMTNSISDIGLSDCIICLGSNPFEQHPLVGRQIIRAQASGGKFIYADPRYTPTAIQADLFLQYSGGFDVAVLNCIMAEIIRKGWEDQEFINTRTREYDSFKRTVLESTYTPHHVSHLTGVSRDDLLKAAEWIGTAERCMFLCSPGPLYRSGGVRTVQAIAHLMMLTGNIGRPGAGVCVLCGQSNVQGTCDMGCLPDFFPGYQPVTDSFAYQTVKQIWNFPDGIAPSSRGLDMNRMFTKADGKYGGIRALILAGENPFESGPDPQTVHQGLKNLDFLVVSEIFFTKTCEYADIVLPAACYAEKDGSVTNTERRVQRLHKAASPPGIAKPDWQIITEIASIMGYAKQFPYTEPADIFSEITRVCNPYQGMTFERISRPDGICWPCPSVDHPGMSILYTDRFLHPDGKGVFCPVEWRPPSEKPNMVYPFLLISGRIIWHWHTGMMTGKSKNLSDEVHEVYVEIHPGDAAKVRISDGERILIRSKKGQLSCKARIVPEIMQGIIFMPTLFDAAVRRLTGTRESGLEKSEYKSIYVAIEPLRMGDGPV